MENVVNIGGRDIQVTLPKRAKNEVLVNVNVDLFDKIWSKDKNFYVGPNGQGGIGSRYQNFEKWISDKNIMDAAEVGISDNNGVVFDNGRHRFAFLRDSGVKSIPVSMPKKDVEKAKKLGLIEANISNEPAAYGSTPNNLEIDYFGVIVSMKPSIFLKLASPLRGGKSIEFFKQAIRDNKPIAPPMFYIQVSSSWKEGKFELKDCHDCLVPEIQGHEGRNRMTALLEEEGDNPVQVHILLRSDSVEWRNRNITPEIMAELNKGIMSENSSDYVSGPLFSTNTITEHIENSTSLSEATNPNSAITRINRALKKAGRDERLVRGRGYYYLMGGDASGFPEASIYSYSLNPEDYDWAWGEVQDMFKKANINLSESTEYYTPKNQTAFASMVDKVAKRLFIAPRAVAYHYTLNPNYYSDKFDSEAFSDKEFALGISDSQTYEDQKNNLKKVYVLTDDEVEEIVGSELFWQNR
jgi:hypothetical protein